MKKWMNEGIELCLLMILVILLTASLITGVVFGKFSTIPVMLLLEAGVTAIAWILIEFITE